MIGQLAVSFCERKSGEACVCLDLWSYPDGTYNLVLENSGGCSDKELVFPCGFHQLAGVLNRKPLVILGDDGSLTIGRCGTFVCAQFEPIAGKDGFSHCIAMNEYRQAIEALEANVVGYLA